MCVVMKKAHFCRSHVLHMFMVSEEGMPISNRILWDVHLMQYFSVNNHDNTIKITQFCMSPDPYINAIIRGFLSS